MSKTSGNGFFNDKNKANGMTQFQSNPNLANFNQYQKMNRTNNIHNYGGKVANNLGGVGHLNIDNGNGMNGSENGLNESNRMNRTSIGFRHLKKTYEEKLDNFMATHNLKYIEPPKIEKKPTPPVVKPEQESGQSTVSNIGKKSNLQKGSGNNKKNNS